MAYELIKKRTKMRVHCHSITIPADYSPDIDAMAKDAGLSAPKFIAKVFVEELTRRLALQRKPKAVR